jgi:hypothetical protein
LRKRVRRKVEDEVSSFEEVKVQKKLVKEGKIEVVENPRFMTEARRKELERRAEAVRSRRQCEVKEKRNSRCFLIIIRSESHAAAAIQQPAVEQERKFRVYPLFLLRPKALLLPKLRFSFQSYRFSFKTEQFSFERVVYR